jgi:hypothetical protein
VTRLLVNVYSIEEALTTNLVNAPSTDKVAKKDRAAGVQDKKGNGSGVSGGGSLYNTEPSQGHQPSVITWVVIHRAVKNHFWVTQSRQSVTIPCFDRLIQALELEDRDVLFAEDF